MTISMILMIMGGYGLLLAITLAYWVRLQRLYPQNPSDSEDTQEAL